MTILLFSVAILVVLVIVWTRSNQNSIHIALLEKRIDQLEKKTAELARAWQDLRAQTRIPAEPVQPKPAAEPKLARVERPSPLPAALKVEEKPPAAPPVFSPLEAPTRQTPPILSAPPLPATPTPQPTEIHAPKPSWTLPKFDWESLVGVKLFSWIAGVALLLAVVFFLRYSINQGWLMPKVRMSIGILVGIGLLALCELKAARRYPVTANAMDASAIAILFSTFYAARARWDLIGAVPAFVLMVAVTAVAVLLSIRRDSAFIALLGLLGGFATPALLSTGENRPISLFAYLLLLNAGLAYVAAQRKWPVLTTLSLIFTVFYQWGWVIKFLTEPQLPTALGIFLVFPILAFAMTSLRQKKGERGEGLISLYGQTANITALLPLLFSLHLAAVPAYGQHQVLLFSFLLLLDAGLFVIAAARGPEILHLIGGISTLAVSAIWLWKSYTSNAWPALLIFITLFGFFYLIAPLITAHFGRSFTEAGRWAAFTAPLLLLMFPALVIMEPAFANIGPFFGVLFLLMMGISAYAILEERGAIYFIGSFFALLAEAVWSYKYLTSERLLSGLALYGIFGLLYIGVPVLARRWGKRLQPEAAGAVLLLISIALLLFLSAGPAASAGIWGLALLLLLLNAGLFWQGTACKIPLFALAGIGLSWIVLGVLWATIPLNALLIPALAVMAGYVLLVLAGNLWLQKQNRDEGFLSNGIFLGLVGHFFLAVVAAQKDLSIPPWPFLCVLLILDSAIGCSSLYLRRNDLHQAAMAVSALLLMIWVVTAGIAPWPAVAIVSAGALALMSFIWMYLAGRVGLDRSHFSRTAAVTVILAQIVATIAATQSGAPGILFLLAAHLILLGALLGLAWSAGKHEYAVFAVFTTAMSVSFWCAQHAGSEFWPRQLLFAIPIYAVFIGYPLLLGRRAGKSIEPYLAAVLASVPFFFQARHAMLLAGWKGIIGILPLTQAFVMGMLLLLLLKIEARGARSLGRLALVAGAALAFVTVAIPLQLEKEWITIGWVLEAAALAWLYGKIPHKGLLYSSAALFDAVFVRLALNPSVLSYELRGGVRIWNWYLYTYLISAVAMILGGWLLSKTDDKPFEDWPRMSKLVPGGGIILLFLLLNIEIADYFSTGAAITFNFSATLAQDLTYTLGWALFAVGLLAVGIAIKSQPARVASLALLVATIVKCFIHDLGRLGGLYRVSSFVGLAICLALVALALQNFVFSARKPGK